MPHAKQTTVVVILHFFAAASASPAANVADVNKRWLQGRILHQDQDHEVATRASADISFYHSLTICTVSELNQSDIFLMPLKKQATAVAGGARDWSKAQQI